MRSRRDVLAALGSLGTALSTAGCLAPTLSDEQSPSSSPPAEPRETPLPPPWLRADGTASDADLVVRNGMEADASGTVRLEEQRWEFFLRSDDDFWSSGDVITDGSTPTVVVTTDDGRRVEVTWPGEEKNERVLVFVLTDDEIRVERRTRDPDRPGQRTTTEP